MMKRLAMTTAIVLATTAAVVLLWYWRGVALIFFASLASAAAVRPLAERLVERGWPRKRALGITYTIAIAVLVGLTVLIVEPLITDVEAFLSDAKLVRSTVAQTWTHGTRLQQMVAKFLLAEPASAALNTKLIADSAVEIGGFLVDATLVVVLSLYWSFDRVHFERLWLSLLAVEKRAPARDIWRQMEAESGRYLRSELVQSIAAGILLNWGFRLLGHPYPVLVAFIGALAWMIPWLGGIFTIGVAVALALPSGMSEGALNWPVAISCGCFTLTVLALLEFYVEPRLFDRSRYNSLLIVLLAIGLTDLFGILGLLLAPPLAAALQILGERLIAQRAAKDQPQAQRAELPLRERLAHLRQTLEESEEKRPQLVSLVNRLEGLVQQAEQIPAIADGNPTPAAG